MAATVHVVDVEQIERLADKVRDLIGVLERTQSELTQTVDDNSKLHLEIESLRSQLASAESVSSEMTTLLTERDQIRVRVQDMLQQLDAINL